MQHIGKYGYLFPDSGNQEEVGAWEPHVAYTVLHRNVMCVARTRVEGAWAAYCGPVPGMNHASEYQLVLVDGDKLSEDRARVLFPQFEGIPYAH
jgi:hypothetical protein